MSRKPGRPPLDAADRKRLVSFRVPPVLIEKMRSTGKGWQTRAVEALNTEFAKPMPPGKNLKYIGDGWYASSGEKVEIEKGPGWDWSVLYRWEDGTTDIVSVFGVLTAEMAIQEARWSLEPLKMPNGEMRHNMLFDILGVWRDDSRVAWHSD